MCRSIKTLRTHDQRLSDEEVEAAALQFVRKISGFRHPSKANEEVFDRAVRDITEASRVMLDGLMVAGRPLQSAS